jgi:hypothetical protein
MKLLIQGGGDVVRGLIPGNVAGRVTWTTQVWRPAEELCPIAGRRASETLLTAGRLPRPHRRKGGAALLGRFASG